MKPIAFCVTAAILAALVLPADAQEKPSPRPEATTPVKVQVVMTRFDGEKKLNSWSYTLHANASDADTRPAMKRLMMGVQVPVTVQVKESPTVAFKDVGANIGCAVQSLGGGRYKLSLDIEQSSIADEASRRTEGSVIAGPVLRTFRDSVEIVLRDGQTMQTSSATDPVSGHVLNVDVTLTLSK